MYILFPENIYLFPLISWFILYLILQAFANQNATRTNEQTRTWVSSKRKKGSFVTLCILRASVDYRVFFAKLLQKRVGMLTLLDYVLLCPDPIFSCLLLLTVSLDSYIKPTDLLCPPLSTASLRLPSSTDHVSSLVLPLVVPFRSRERSRAQALCLGFAPKQAKRPSDRRTHTHPTQWPHSVIY